jgi:hypothetical protein
MKLSSVLITIATFALAGCSTPSKVDSGPIHGTTFNFIRPPSQPSSGSVDETQQVHAAVQQAIIKNLAQKGVTMVPTGGDLTVAYLLITGNNVSTSFISTYFGYSDDLEGLQDKAFNAYTGSDQRNAFAAGTLLIDIIDNKKNALVKRAYATRPLLQNPSPQERAANVESAVNEILRDVHLEH